MTPGWPLLAAFLSAIASAALLHWRHRLPHAALNARTLHQTPIPRVGGLAIWAGWLPVAWLTGAGGAASLGWLVPLVALIVISAIDDWRGVPVLPRLVTHALAAVWFAIWLGAVSDTPLGVQMPLLIGYALIAMWSLNLYNFMDGSDGLAALMTIVGFLAYAVVAVSAGVASVMMLALAAATIPLLVVNRPPARMFLGDVGAVPLGFLAAVFGIAGVTAEVWRWWFPLLVFFPFIADATVTLVRRALRGERVWEAHKVHYYQRLNRMGAGHRGTLATFGALMVATAGTATACACWAPDLGPLVLAAWCAVYVLLFAAIDYHWRKNNNTAPR